ncbi:PfkB family carbohydrate kinase [Streptomyces sp. NBC_01795]|uniref:PfkB family carbohydrate kinase n=1 Tax=unclassified Streptomyces TaxID=2593676 RepID=UPI002DD9DEFE|nr:MULTISPECIES: PfkB family carbohydrate kinase [unclassified Streptomyces]WSA90396.1 PfkB family carbohydrate kinase [Streptomyces sp. NBC_01795]WSS16993.1 PfkB family carbohydrate kinase [Streptomyces sp. NBC_01186]
MRICGVGDNVVDRYPQRGLMYPGGNAVNVAVHAARCGAEAAYLGVLGTDEAGGHIRTALDAEGVGTDRVRTADGPNAYATVRLDAEGNRHFAGSDEGVSRFTPDDADLDWLAGFDLLHTGDCSGLEHALPLLARACPLSYDFSDRPWPYAEPLLPHVRYAVFSRPGAGDREAAALADAAHRAGPETVIVTRGGGGALVSRDGVPHLQPVTPVEVVDTLGAGDSFVARLMVALLDGAAVPSAAAQAAAYAAEVCTHEGAFGHPRVCSDPHIAPVR